MLRLPMGLKWRLDSVIDSKEYLMAFAYFYTKLIFAYMSYLA
jgi:hypothetical protein